MFKNQTKTYYFMWVILHGLKYLPWAILALAVAGGLSK
jgi:hypothetical protein